jgi:hypothetical protein
MGAGPGTAALGQPSQVAQQDMGKFSQSLPYFEMLANMPDANPSTRMLVNLVKGMS